MIPKILPLVFDDSLSFSEMLCAFKLWLDRYSAQVDANFEFVDGRLQTIQLKLKDLPNPEQMDELMRIVTSVQAEIVLKQDVLTPGPGITIDDNVITCTVPDLSGQINEVVTMIVTAMDIAQSAKNAADNADIAAETALEIAEEAQTDVTRLAREKQNVLIAGDNVSIENDVISAANDHEPDHYIALAAVSRDGNTLHLFPNDSDEITFSPETGGSGEPENYLLRIEISADGNSFTITDNLKRTYTYDPLAAGYVKAVSEGSQNNGIIFLTSDGDIFYYDPEFYDSVEIDGDKLTLSTNKGRSVEYVPTFKSGETIASSKYTTLSGLCINSKQVVLDFPLPKSFGNLTPTITRCSGYLYGISGSMAGTDVNFMSGTFTTTITDVMPYRLRITIADSVNFSKYAASTPVAFHGLITIAFN